MKKNTNIPYIYHYGIYIYRLYDCYDIYLKFEYFPPKADTCRKFMYGFDLCTTHQIWHEKPYMYGIDRTPDKLFVTDDG